MLTHPRSVQPKTRLTKPVTMPKILSRAFSERCRLKSFMNGTISIVACQISMDVMGVNREDLIDGLRIGGVTNYLEEAEASNLNLFI